MFDVNWIRTRRLSASTRYFLVLIISLIVFQYGQTSYAERPGSNTSPMKPALTTGGHGKMIGREADNMYIRSETHIGCRIEGFSYESENTGECIHDGPEPDFQIMIPQFVKLPPGSKGFVDIPRAAGKFVVDKKDTTVAITFSAMSYVSSLEDDPLLIRVLVDGVEAQPGEITLTGGKDAVVVSTSQSFTFLATVNGGIHTVQVQYSTEFVPDKNSYIRNASLKINTGENRRDGDGLSGKGERKGIKKGDKSWSAIPNSEHTFYMPKDGEAAITFSSVIKMEQGDFVLLRAIVDNGAFELYPVEATLAGRMYHTEARSVTFNAEDLPPGPHTVEFEWRGSLTDVPAIAEMFAWTIVVRTAVNDSKDNFFDVVSQNAFDSSGETPYTPVTNLTTKVEVDEVSDIAVTFSGELAGYGLIFVAPTINGIVEEEQEVILYHPILSCPDPACASLMASDSGVASYTFGIKSISPSEDGYEIGVAYRVLQAGVTTEGTGFIADANLVVEKKLRVGPDLAVGPNMGRASKKRESIIEPVYGSRDLLAIIIDPETVEGEVSPKFKEEIDDALNGDFQSAKDYYMVVSGGRFEIEKADTLGIYKAENADETTNGTNYYLDSANFDCEQDTKYGSSSDALHAEALLQAEDDFDFSAYDKNSDGEITPNELGIIVAIPRDSIAGSSIKPSFSPYCSEEAFIVDGVRITETVHLNVLFQEGGLTDDQKLENMMVAAHELAHHFLGMDDLYGRYKGVFDGENFTPLFEFQDDCPDDLGPGQSCQIRYVNTAPHMMSLMTHKTGDNMTTTHLDGFHKLHLGWVRPWILEEKDEYELADVKESEDVFILPRRHDDGREYIQLETRYDEIQQDSALYDYGILDYGLAVYHVIEPGPTCKSPFGASAPDCKPLVPPMCVGEDVWYFKHASNFTRVGVRLVQPDLVHRYDQDIYDSNDDYTGFSNTLFGLGGSGETLISDGEMICPQNIGDVLPAGGAPLLLWVDGTPSGYNLLDIIINYPVGVSFKLVID